MISKLLKSIHLEIGGAVTGFDRYFQNLQSQTGADAPSRELARRDYKALYRIR